MPRYARIAPIEERRQHRAEPGQREVQHDDRRAGDPQIVLQRERPPAAAARHDGGASASRCRRRDGVDVRLGRAAARHLPVESGASETGVAAHARARGARHFTAFRRTAAQPIAAALRADDSDASACQSRRPPTSLTYRAAGVDIDAGDALVERIKPYAKRTMRPEVLAGIGGFGALFEIGKRFREPVLVAGTDGVGTKLKLAFALDGHDTIGIDLVAMSVNDVLVQGAEPLFFLDYFACGTPRRRRRRARSCAASPPDASRRAAR